MGRILEMILYWGLGMVVVTAVTTFVCLPAFPTMAACVQLTPTVSQVLAENGFTITMMGAPAGGFIFVIAKVCRLN